MRITRFIHSCVLVEDNGRAVLIDPGYFSWESGLVNIAELPDLSELAITHDHADHFHLQFVQELVERFPELIIVTTPSVQQQLAAVGIVETVTTASSELITIFDAPHETLSPGMGQPPENIGVHVFGKLTHPGDSHHFDQSKDVLALPVSAPWGSLTRAVELALELQPKAIVPIHDWHWHDAARTSTYDQLSKIFAGHTIHFISPSDGQPDEI